MIPLFDCLPATLPPKVHTLSAKEAHLKKIGENGTGKKSGKRRKEEKIRERKLFIVVHGAWGRRKM